MCVRTLPVTGELDWRGRGSRDAALAVLGKGRLSVGVPFAPLFEVRSSVCSVCTEITLAERSEGVGRCEDNVSYNVGS